ncbi:unnamed protein product [Fraxinus pennsylvanica]|uniref:Uncharacterized protein n=1 Tax=Fraxinus pennsylvanica TaxID=56036 RepID=A0AAD1ZVT4_9LAMI|nr:unnamed protein product [Fraxinus pennsylvanica]
MFLFGIICDVLGSATSIPLPSPPSIPLVLEAPILSSLLPSDFLSRHDLLALHFHISQILCIAAGAVGGAVAIMEVMPIQYKHMLGGPSLKVDLHTGAIAEGVLTFTITFAVLLIVLRGPSNPLVKNWLLAMSTV